MHKISELRQEYKKHSLDESTVNSDALVQFSIWFTEAVEAKVPEPNAFTLSTSDLKGRPSARVLLLKGLEKGGLTYFTNYLSRKALESDSNENVALTFLWLELERQVRIYGKASRLSRDESEAYFHSRPRESQIGAWVSPQSKVIPDRKYLEDRMNEKLREFEETEIIPLPDFWGGYLIIPEEVEFWQGRPNRLHDRILYKKNENGWLIERLAP
ncbi:MAG: pyridoxamine 5'-phosphate oxidase [Saprospiraceae bacterium]|nr:pyridoxamine 5'-phosphate oxidase [Saprospiraceae bacterium]